MTFFLTAITAVLAATAAVRAAPLNTLVKRCNVPSTQDASAVDTAYRICVEMGCDAQVAMVMIDTCIQESNCNPLDCGDQDSQGMYQQRPSEGWGTVEQCRDPDHSTRAFLAVAIPAAAADPGAPNHVIAQRVQDAQAGDLYAHDGLALEILQAASKRTGIPLPKGLSGGASGNKPAASSKPASTKAAPTPAASVSIEGAGNVGAAPSSKAKTSSHKATSTAHKTSTAAPKATSTPDPEEGECSESGSPANCDKWVRPVPGNSCWQIANDHHISLDNFYKWNTQLEPGCPNLEVTFDYCIGVKN